ncbi:uncharacterized protein DUF4833 [Larkinella arboricola]|uniref:Uncharacterized protein DUF4833 n=1 Tax=Larkinella arboricola TaxID=643671 RepID=A0A327X612_LARAB|nr:DUF4833 domain-containing protein [Larkinella arboricola]RAK02375.1 uncharacterized protein DUF4833 [Larkinella arboricola]
MNYRHLFFLLFLLELTSAFTTAAGGASEFPVPPPAPNRLFYIQRSNDANTVIYEANVTAGRQLNAEDPVHVYWIRYAEQGQRESLSMFQWKMAYGYKHKPLAQSDNSFEIHLNAFKKRPIWVDLHQGKPVALTTINGRKACLRKVFVQLDSDSGLLPKVEYIELFGTDPGAGTPVYERIRV